MDVLETVFLKILDMSLTASYVILAVLLVRLLLKRAPKVFSYALWSVAAFRLVCPVSFASVVSIFNIGTLLAPQSVGRAAIQPTVSTGNMATSPQTSMPPALTNSLQTVAETQSADPMQTILTVAAVLWCAGVAAMLVYSIISYLKIRRGVTQAVRLEDNVYECDGISPFVFGIIKPKIYIPFRMSEKERSCILCHERHHIRRLDHVIKPIAFVILTVYWFHPLVWLAYIFMCKDMEMSCDEKVISLMGTTAKQEYSLSLLSVGINRRLAAAGPLFFGESDVKSRVKNVLCFKKPKVWAVVLAVMLCVAVAVACTADEKTDVTVDVTPQIEPIESVILSLPEDVAADDTLNIVGRYEFEENVYTNPLSSFFAVKGHMPYFDITDNALRIVDEKFDTVEEYAGTFAPANVSEDDFEALFQNDIVVEGMIPDISVYKKCKQYAVFTDEYNRLEYSLYLMDDEVWLASLNTKRVWSIYRLVKSGDISESTVGGADGPQNVFEDVVTLEICFNKDVMDVALLIDDESKNTVRDIIAQSEDALEHSANADIFDAGDYFRLILSDGTIYYVFHNGEEPRIQKMNEDNSQTALPQSQYEMLYALWENHMDLPAKLNVVSGDNTVTPLVYRAGSVPALQEIKDKIPYLTVDPQGADVPFNAFEDGDKIYGIYEVYDTQTLNPLEFIKPSGLEPQTYLFSNAQKGDSYIVMQSTGYLVGEKTYGYTIIFGASL